MTFALVLACTVAACFALRNPLKACPMAFYAAALLVDVAFVAGTFWGMPRDAWSVFFVLIQKCLLPLALFVVVMYIGVLDRGSRACMWLKPVRAELSIVAWLLSLGHVAVYGATYLPRIASGGATNGNVAASFAVAVVLLALLAVLGVSLSFFGKLCVELAGYGGRAAEPTQAFFVWIAAILLLSLGVSVWGIALSIYNGVTFNRRYFEQQHGDPAVPAHTGAVVGGAAAWVGVYIIAVVALVAALLPAAMQDAQQHQAPGTLPYAQSVPQALPDDNATYGTEHYGAAVSDALEAHWGEGSDQALLNGYIPAQAAGGTLEERLRGSHLFYSDARTLDELFAAAEDVQWYTDYEPDADGTEYADASWIMGDTVLVCVFAVSDTYTWVVDFYSYLNGEDPTADGCYTFWDEERSALLLELYGENAPEEPSLARQMRGAWVDGAGGAVLLDESFFDGTDYTLGTMMDGGVQCWVQDDGSYIVFVLDETGNALTARWYDGSGTLRAEQSFTRGTPG